MGAIDKTDLFEQTKFRLDETIKIENYFVREINQRKSVLSAATGGVSSISFTSNIEAPVGIASAIFTLIFSLTTGIVKKLLNITRKKRKSMIKFLCLLKVNLVALRH